ncbi:lysozyme inhibitor LprI family protein [Jannaschia formosa]|uniref:lysozyme inhibitor LprI family protein n=1 Tax=Jannaschia formosa TaxID=2259592 RepID=UPI000E1B789E|nr:lysozyme inhibitor LprI family protein [Jannaschia formosa]TFL18553.1 DUF1311 domain-containing protein [Jannaschia formosa]
MRKLLIAAALLAAAPASGQTSIDCSSRQTQLDLNFCARDGWVISDAELNRLWKEVKPAADRRGIGEALLEEQRAWLRRRALPANPSGTSMPGVPSPR